MNFTIVKRPGTEWCRCDYAEDIDVKIDGPGQAEVLKKEQQDSKVAVVYRTLSPGEFDIHIKNKGKAIHGSPFSAKISGENFVS